MFTTHQIPLLRLDKSRTHEFSYVPDAKKISELTKFIEFRKITITSFKGILKPLGDGVDLKGKLVGQATQNCVISGAPVHTKLNHDIIRKYRKDITAFEVDIAHEDNFDDTYDVMPANLELDDLLCESILLLTPEYPKLSKYLESGEWSISTGEVEASTENDRPNPFANLDEKLFGKKTDET